MCAISGGKPVLVVERYWLKAWRSSVLCHKGLSAFSDWAGFRYRLLRSDLAGQWTMACSRDSSSERQRGQEGLGTSDRQEGWAAR